MTNLLQRESMLAKDWRRSLNKFDSSASEVSLSPAAVFFRSLLRVKNAMQIKGRRLDVCLTQHYMHLAAMMGLMVKEMQNC